MTITLTILAVCTLALAAWWHVRTMRRADAAYREWLLVLDAIREQERRAVNLRLDRLCELLGYDTEKTGLESPPTTEDAT